ncbi:hypothetical protein GJ744_011252 [Endocarpon pusillum]|uniref:ATP synthase subunit f n=1 Tax=Endocarpon pusillum TaxID=364733 RepID=A0A8H7ATQ5_9EURO|nr:hypothetical protein GJ744_011252 [Endocarpon pusillum]
MKAQPPSCGASKNELEWFLPQQNRRLPIMSFVIRRSLTTLVPPKVANPEGLGAAKDAVRMARIAKFYERLPKGPMPEIKPRGLLERYQHRYFGKNPSAAPIWHAIISIMALGYSMEYYFHLRHHKNNAH